MAEGLSEQRALPAPPTETLVAPRERPEDRRVYRFRFGIAYLALAVLAGVGVGSAIIFADRPPKDTGEQWSSWRPKGAESTFDDQIAQYVGRRYRLPSRKQLVTVAPGPPTIHFGETPISIETVVIQDDPRGNRDGLRPVSVGNGAMYQLCGDGNQCTITERKPTQELYRVLRREALELALYTFKYRESTDTVIALLPPSLGDPDKREDDRAIALFFERGELRNELERPLAQTLLASQLPQVAELDPREDLAVERLTGDRVFLYDFRPVQSGGAIMLLQRPASSG